MTKDELLELADRCEREEATFALEGDIFEAVGGPLWDWAYERAQEPCGCPHETAVFIARHRAPRFTTSMDAAASLIPEGAEWDLTTLYGVARVAVGLNMDVGPHYASHKGGLLPMAICAAALRARASTPTQGEG